MNFLSETQVLMEFLIPFNEVVTKFYNRVKSSTSGHATINFEAAGFVESDLVKIDLKINDNLVNQLSVICLRKQAPELGKKLAERLRQSIDRQQFEILIQASIGSKVVAKERIPPYRRDVLTTRGGKAVGGGDKTRKQKLLAQQKESKKRMKAVGQVEVPQEAFLAVLKL